jgi:hypothetical protein
VKHRTLRAVEDDLARMAALAPKLSEAARWAWPLAFSRLRRRDDAARDAEVSRPVEAAVATEGAPEWVVRDNVGRAGILIGRAAAFLELAAGCLARAQESADVAPTAPADRARLPLVSKAELVAAKAAQARRHAARQPGEGHGER